MRDRPAERAWLHHDETPRASFDEVAEVAGIRPLGRAWVEIDARKAEELLTEVLHVDLVYSTEHMPEHRARWLAREFVGAGGSCGTRFGTNTDGDPHTNGSSWTPATEFTFDCGVVALGPSGSACCWIADEV